MVIDQRNAGASVTPNGGYTLDRWAAGNSQASKFSVQQNAGSVTRPAGFTYYLGVTSLSAYTVGAAEQFFMYQPIEGYNVADLGWGTANAKTITLSFWVRSSLTGTFGGSILNSAQNRSYPFSYTISAANTWEQKSVTIAGDTSGTWLTTNGIGMYISIGLGVGATNSGTAGAWAGTTYYSATGATSVVGTNGATLYFTGVQLEVGTQATSFEYRQYGTELNLCQRYCYALGTAGGNLSMNSVGAMNSTTLARMLFSFPTTMRAAPTAAFSAANTFIVQQQSVGGTNFTPTAVTGTAINSQSMYIEFTVSGATGGTPTILYDATSAAKITLSAEL
jgi:hypothetical protein